MFTQIMKSVVTAKYGDLISHDIYWNYYYHYLSSSLCILCMFYL